MRKLLLLLSVLMLGACHPCIYSQIPPQYIYAGEGCQGVLPDYLPMLRVTDNCEILSITQHPSAGYALSGQEQTVTVMVTATDVFNNVAQVMFTVTLIDTIPPVIFYDTTLVADNWRMVNSLYNAADRIIARQEAYFDDTFPWETVQVGDSIVGIPEELRPIGEYANKIMITWTSPAFALTGQGGRAWTWQQAGDTIVIQ
jgi:hypothetical protein